MSARSRKKGREGSVGKGTREMLAPFPAVRGRFGARAPLWRGRRTRVHKRPEVRERNRIEGALGWNGMGQGGIGLRELLSSLGHGHSR